MRRLFRAPQRVVTTGRHDQVTACLAVIEQDCEAGATAIGWLSYEAAPAFDRAFGPAFGQITTPIALDPWLAGVAIGFAVLIGIVGGAYPAMRAARMDPALALRQV